MVEAVVLGDLELEAVGELVVEEHRRLAMVPVPGWTDGELVQDLGPGAATIRLRGCAIDAGDGLPERLEQLRRAAATGKPLDFAASAAVASTIEQVLVARLAVHQHGAQPDAYHYELDLVQYIEPPAQAPGGFDTGALGDLAAAADLAAATNLAACLDGLPLGELSQLEELAAGAGKALEVAGKALEYAAEVAGALDQLDKLRPLLSAMEGVVSAASTFKP